MADWQLAVCARVRACCVHISVCVCDVYVFSCVFVCLCVHLNVGVLRVYVFVCTWVERA